MAADIKSDLLLHWKGGGSGSTVTDSSGGAIGDGTLANNITLLNDVSDLPTGSSYAISKTASNGVVVSASNFTTPETSDVTFAFWLKQNGLGGQSYIVNTRDSAGSGSLTCWLNNTTSIQMQPGTGNAVGTTWTLDNLSDGEWHHIVMVFETAGGGAGHLWQDGAWTDTDSTMSHTTAWPTNGKVRLFERGGGTTTGTYQLADVRIYDRALALGTGTDTDGNIAALYAWREPGGSHQQLLIP